MGTDADNLLADLSSADEHVRARAAVALAHMHHPRALDACIGTLDDAAEMAHADSTPAVYCLAEMGLPALPPLLEKLATAEPMTRLRAQRAVEKLTSRVFGFDGRHWPDDAYRRWATWWTQVGYTYNAPETNRASAVERLRQWMAHSKP